MWKRLLAWLALIGLLQLALLALYHLGGSFSYMGGRDDETMRTALALYGTELRPFLLQLWGADALALGVWMALNRTEWHQAIDEALGLGPDAAQRARMKQGVFKGLARN